MIIPTWREITMLAAALLTIGGGLFLAGYEYGQTAPQPTVVQVDEDMRAKASRYEDERDLAKEREAACQERAAQLKGQVVFVERWLLAARRMREVPMLDDGLPAVVPK